MSGGEGRVPGIREWLTGAAYPWPDPAGLPDGELLVGCFCVVESQLGQTRHDKPFLRLRLSDRHGVFEGRVWEDAERAAASVPAGGFVGVRARVETFRDQRQLRVESVEPVRVSPEEMSLFLPSSPRDPAEMESELAERVASVGDAPLRHLLERVLDESTETGRWFRRAPAAKFNHHAYVGGLLEHTLSVTAACEALARHYGEGVDRDLLLAGALLHDLGKIRELAVESGFSYTDEGRLLGHILLGLEIVEEAARAVPGLTRRRLLLLRHLIASHQGRFEWQSPREPLTIEALILHYADDLDAKLFQVYARLGEVEDGWSGFDRSLGRSFLRHRAGGYREGGGAGSAPAARPARGTERGRDGADAPPGDQPTFDFADDE